MFLQHFFLLSSEEATNWECLMKSSGLFWPRSTHFRSFWLVLTMKIAYFSCSLTFQNSSDYEIVSRRSRQWFGQRRRFGVGERRKLFSPPRNSIHTCKVWGNYRIFHGRLSSIFTRARSKVNDKWPLYRRIVIIEEVVKMLNQISKRPEKTERKVGSRRFELSLTSLSGGGRWVIRRDLNLWNFPTSVSLIRQINKHTSFYSFFILLETQIICQIRLRDFKHCKRRWQCKLQLKCKFTSTFDAFTLLVSRSLSILIVDDVVVATLGWRPSLVRWRKRNGKFT